MLEGRGLFCGAANARGQIRVMGEPEWTALCQKAQGWGMTAIHPKLADGPVLWYTQEAIAMLLTVAGRFGLRVVPYHYCYGNTYPYGGNPNHLEDEAAMCASLGTMFGAVMPDIEVQWNGQSGWATQFGEILRKRAPHVEVYPNLFPNPREQATPYLEILKWATGWMPMVYFDVWTQGGHPMTALEAIEYVFPQWETLDTASTKQGVPSRPILPIIELGDHLPPGEVQVWLTKMQDYGYCGFWYDGVYAPYAQTVLDAPLPRFKREPLVPSPPPPGPSSVASPAILPMGGTGTQPLQLPTLVGLSMQNGALEQLANEAELRFLWHLKVPTIPWNPQHALCAAWIWLHLKRPDIWMGSPTSDEIAVTIDGVDAQVLPLSSGRMLVWYKQDGRTFLH